MSATEIAVDERAAVAPEKQEGAKAKPNTRLILGAVVGALALTGLGWWFVHRGIEDTDDAQIDGDVISVPARTTGPVTAIHFTDNQTVKAGQLLAELDSAPQTAKFQQAEADLASAQASAEAAEVEAHLAETNAKGQRSVAKASLKGAVVGIATTSQQIEEADAQLAVANANYLKAKQDLDRDRRLVAQSAMAQSQLDAAQATHDALFASVTQAKARAAELRSATEQAQARVSEANARFEQASTVDQQIANARARAKVAEARVGTAKAVRDLAALELSYTKITAPKDGVVSRRAINIGQMVVPGTPIVMLVPEHDLWVTGNFKETQLERMRPGQSAKVKIDAFGGLALSGKVESFSAATGARFSLLPPDNATGNYTKVVQRVPVRVVFKDLPAGVVLRPGMSVELAVDTNN